TRRPGNASSTSGASARTTSTSASGADASAGSAMTRSPRWFGARIRSGRGAPFTRILVADLEHGQERLLRDLDGADLLHATLPLLLLLQELALARDVTAVALGRHVLPHRTDRLPRDDPRTDRRLDRDLEELAGDQLPQLLRQRTAVLVRLVRMDDHAEGIDGLPVDQHVQLDQVVRAVLQELPVERRIAPCRALEPVVAVEHDLREGELVDELDARRVEIVHRDELAAAIVAELLHVPDVIGRAHDPGPDVRLLDPRDLRALRQGGRVLDCELRPVGQDDVVLHVRDRRDQVEPELPLEALLHDLQVQQPEEPAPETEPERRRGLRLVLQARVVQLEAFQRVAQLLVLIRVRRVEPAEDHGLDLAVPGEQLRRPTVRVQDRVADARVADALDRGRQVPDLTGAEFVLRDPADPHEADLVDLVDRIVGPERDPHPRPEHAVHDPDARDRALILVVERV